MASSNNNKNRKPPVSPTPKPDLAKTKTPALPQRVWLIAIMILVLMMGYMAYAPGLHNEFTSWDDPGYVTENQEIRQWNSTGIKHLFDTHTFVMGNYHPLTMLSLAKEYHDYGLKPYYYHRDSLIFHLIASLAVTLLVWLLTRNTWMTAFCGLIFTVHPMHVESVTWVAGRKDVLFGMFFFLGLIAWFYYIRYFRLRPALYLVFLVLFIAALMSKAVAVTLPICCLLMDLYVRRKFSIWVVVEKIPMLALSVFFGLISIKAQSQTEAMHAAAANHGFNTILFAAYAFMAYIWKFILPLNLSNLYPYPDEAGSLPVIFYVAPLLVLALIAVIYSFGRKNRDVLFGTLFYAVTIFLLIQLLPVGQAIIADRYSYVAYFGLAFVAASLLGKGLNAISVQAKQLKPLWIAIGAGFVIYFTAAARERTTTWKNSETLWKDETEKQPTVPDAFYNLALLNQNAGQTHTAVELYSKCIAISPTFADAYLNRGDLYRAEGKNKEALSDLNKAITLRPNQANGYLSRGIVYAIENKLDSAGKDFDMAVKLNPNSAETYSSRGNYHDMKGEYQAAIADWTHAIALKPDLADAYIGRGNAEMQHNENEKAIEDLTTYLQYKTDVAQAYMSRSNAYAHKKDYAKAYDDLLQAQKLGMKIDAAYAAQLKAAAGK